MKILLCFLVFIFCLQRSISQEINGTVVDENGIPLDGASVYYDGTTIGTTTNNEGKFSIAKHSLNTNLVVSFLGYETVYFSFSSLSDTLLVVLKESLITFEDVVLTSSKFSRNQLLKVFKKHFLGDTKAGKSCKIINEQALILQYDSKKFTLTVFSNEPILVENPYLGYKIYFDLLSFESIFNSYSIEDIHLKKSAYYGTSRFEEKNTDKKGIKNREKSYNGSGLELFRIISKANWANSKFQLFKGSFSVDPNSIFEVKDSLDTHLINIKSKPEKDFLFKEPVYVFSILYDKKEQSKIYFLTKEFEIDAHGLFSPVDKIMFSGLISEKKLGDMLPFDYQN